MSLPYYVTCLAIGALIAFALAGEHWSLVWLGAVAVLIGVLIVIDRVRPRRG